MDYKKILKNFDEEEIKKLAKNQDKDGGNLFFYALYCNKIYNLNINEKKFDFLIKNSDLNQADREKNSALMIAIRQQNHDKNLNDRQFDYLLKNCNLKQINTFKQDALMLLLAFCARNKTWEITNDHWDYLINNSDLTFMNIDGTSSAMIALTFSKLTNLNLKENQWDKLINSIDINNPISNKKAIFSELLELKEELKEKLLMRIFKQEPELKKITSKIKKTKLIQEKKIIEVIENYYTKEQIKENVAGGINTKSNKI